MGSETKNTVVVIPSYNEAKTIGSVVLDIIRMGLSVLVIDDGSRDSTERIALDNGAMVLGHKRNMGKGFSVREAICHVLEKTNFEWMIIMDGDGQHHSEDIPLLMNATERDSVDMVIGNRMLYTKNMPFSRYWTNRFTSWVISRICRQHIPDTQCGFRLIKTNALKRLKLVSKKYDIETEMLIKAAENHMRISSVPIQTIYGEEVSDIHPVRDTVKFCLLILKYHFNQVKMRNQKPEYSNQNT